MQSLCGNTWGVGEFFEGFINLTVDFRYDHLMASGCFLELCPATMKKFASGHKKAGIMPETDRKFHVWSQEL